MAKAEKSRKFEIKVKPLTSLKAWKDLKAHAREVAQCASAHAFRRRPAARRAADG